VSNPDGGTYRKKCNICRREFPLNAIGPLRLPNRTLFVCSECDDDHRHKATEDA